MSITIHVNAALAVATESTASASFATPLLLDEHTVTGDRQNGPYFGIAEVEAAGFTVAAAPAAHAWASAMFAQRPHVASIMIGRRAASEHVAVAMSAVELVAPASFYGVYMSSNVGNDIMAMAAWTATRFKIALLQTSDAASRDGDASAAQVSTFTVGGTTDGVYSIACTNAWTGALIGTASYTASGDTADDIATALRSAWDGVAELAGLSAPAAGTGADVEITFDGLGNGYTFVLVAASTMTESTPAFAQNVMQLTAALGYDRTAVVYHDDDTEHVDGAWGGRCHAFQLEAPNGNGTWAYHVPKGVTATSLTTAQKLAITAANGNYLSPVTYTSGVVEDGFTWEGTMASGQYIDEQVTQDLTQARIEEAILKTFLRAASTNSPKINMDDEGIDLLGAAAFGPLDTLVRANHYSDGAVSDLTGRVTPYIDVPTFASLSSVQKAARIITMSGEAVFAPAIHKVGDPTTVGVSLSISF